MPPNPAETQQTKDIQVQKRVVSRSRIPLLHRRRYSDPPVTSTSGISRGVVSKDVDNINVSSAIRKELNQLVGEVIRPLLADIRCRFDELKVQQAQTASKANDVVRDIIQSMQNFHAEHRPITGNVENEMKNVRRTQVQQQQALLSVDEVMQQNFSVADRALSAQQARIDSLGRRNIRSRINRGPLDASASDPSSSSSAMPCEAPDSYLSSSFAPCEANRSSSSYPSLVPCEVNQPTHRSPVGIVPCEVSRTFISPSGVPCEVNACQSPFLTHPNQPINNGIDSVSAHPTSFVPPTVQFPSSDRNRFPSDDRNISPPAAPMMPMKLIPPPEFSAARYATWKKEVNYWRELYSYVSEGQIMCTLGLTATSELKRILMHFVKTTRHDPRLRSINNLFAILGENYAVSSREKRWPRWRSYLYSLKNRMNPSRFSGIDTQPSWTA